MSAYDSATPIMECWSCETTTDLMLVQVRHFRGEVVKQQTLCSSCVEALELWAGLPFADQ